MKIEGDVIEFVSVPQCYVFEASGSKPNTVRLLSKAEYLELTDAIHTLVKIRIVHSVFDDVFFERELTNVLRIGVLVGHYLVVFSWRHEE